MEGPYTEGERMRDEGPRTAVRNGKLTGQPDSLVLDGAASGSRGHFTEKEPAEKKQRLPTKQRDTDTNPPRGGSQVSLDHCLTFAACCLAALVSMGTAFSVASVYVDVIDTFGTSRALAAVVQSLAVGVGFGAGIITGPFMGHVGESTAMMIGGLLQTTGCVGSSLAPNIYVLIVCFGGLTGVGTSCCYLAAQVVMGTTFQTHRSVVIAMVMISGGVGMTVFPILFRSLVDAFSLRGMFLIVGGVCLHSVLFGMVIRVFGRQRKLAATAEQDFIVEKQSSSVGTELQHMVGEKVDRDKGGGRCAVVFEEETEPRPVILSDTLKDRSAVTLYSSEDDGPAISEQPDSSRQVSGVVEKEGRLEVPSRQAPESELQVMMENQVIAEKEARRIVRTTLETSLRRCRVEHGLEVVTGEQEENGAEAVRGLSPTYATPQCRVGNDLKACTNGLAEENHRPMIESLSMTGPDKYLNSVWTEPSSEDRPIDNDCLQHDTKSENDDNSAPTVENYSEGRRSFDQDKEQRRHDQATTGNSVSGNSRSRPSAVSISDYVEVWGSAAGDNRQLHADVQTSRERTQSRATGRRRSSTVSEVFQLGLLRNKRYVIITLACYSVFAVVNSPGIFIVDIVKGRGLSVEQGTQLLSIMYGSNVAGRGLVALLQNVSHVSSLKLFMTMLCCCGLSAYGFALLDYYDGYDVFVGYALVSVVFGLLHGGFITCCPLNCLELVGLHQYAQALGYQYFIGGLSTSLGGPLVGWLKDVTDSYTPLFYVIVCHSLLATLITTVTEFCHRKSLRTKQDALRSFEKESDKLKYNSEPRRAKQNALRSTENESDDIKVDQKFRLEHGTSYSLEFRGKDTCQEEKTWDVSTCSNVYINRGANLSDDWREGSDCVQLESAVTRL